ncbi:MAG: NAD+ synthase [Bacteriovoracaceae bacterium]
MELNLHVHQTHLTIGDLIGAVNYIQQNINEEGLHLLPELFLTGYPLQDLCLQQPFIDSYLVHLELINKWSQKEWKAKNTAILMGGLNYHFDNNGLPYHIQNVVFCLIPGKKLEVVYTKRLLPNYDIFDEQKYFDEGKENIIWDFNGFKIAPLICEDMWPSNFYSIDPVEEIRAKAKDGIDIIVNLSASPFQIGKLEKRIERAKEISEVLSAPFLYVNKAGGEDEVLFDGLSFFVENEEVKQVAKAFASHNFKVQISKNSKTPSGFKTPQTVNTWESLFNPQFDHLNKGVRLKKLSDDELESTLQALKFGIQEYAKKSGFKKFLVALSGGIDSSLVLTIAHMALEDEQDLEAIFMPSSFSSTESRELSEQLCQNLGVRLRQFPIKFLHSNLRTAFADHLSSPLEGLSDENIQSRLRGMLLYARSNQTGAMVLNTSNKSELSVGYSTLYGDSVGAISVLGDLYKTEVFQLAQYINHKHGHQIPARIIDRPPTAELRDDQTDSQTLPAYEILDPILEGFLSYRLSPSDIVDLGFSKEVVLKVFNLYQKAEYKRSQFCPILKLKGKSFGFGYRVPICKTIRDYI